MDKLINELKENLIKALNLEGMTTADIEDEAPLFGDDGLGLDSIDALEIIVMLEKNTVYGSKMPPKVRRSSRA